MARETRRLVQLVLEDESDPPRDPAKVMDMLLAKARSGDRKDWLMAIGDRADVEV
jgi:topoisomerase-4 subunit B